MESTLEKIGITRRHLNYMLSGDRNASKKLAIKIESVTRIPKAVFIFGTPEERRLEWEKYLKRRKK